MMRCKTTYAKVVETVCPVAVRDLLVPFFVEGQEQTTHL